MRHKPTIGLIQQQFITLVSALLTHLTWQKPNEKPRELALVQALKATLLYQRHNLTVNY